VARVILDKNAKVFGEDPQCGVRELVQPSLVDFHHIAGAHSDAVRPGLDLYYFPLAAFFFFPAAACRSLMR